MKKVLIISYYWPPSGGSGVQRWVKFVKYLPSLDWEPIIYTPENPSITTLDKSLENEIPASIKVIKKPIFELYGLYRLLSGKKGNASQANPITSKTKSWLDKLFLTIRGNLFIPDPRVTWVCPSVRFLKKYLEENPIDMIISTGPPHSMHLIAKKLAAITNTPWIADFRDPWTKIFYFKHLNLFKWAEKRYKKLEKEVLDKASAIVAVSPLVQEDFQKMTKTKVHLITNGYDESDFEQIVEADGFFNITHTGLLVADGNPDKLWKAIAHKIKEDSLFAKMLRIRLIGKTDNEVIESIKNEGLGEYLIDLGYLNHQTAIRELKNASILILPVRKEPETKAILPGKLFEYLAAQKPILGLGESDSAMTQIINQTNSGIVCDWEDEDKILNFLNNVWNDFNSYKDNENNISIEQFSRKNLSIKMVELMNSLIKK